MKMSDLQSKKIISISKETDDTFKVKYMTNEDEEKEEFYKEGKEFDFSYGDVIGKKDDVYIIQKDDTVKIYDKDLNEIDSLSGTYIKYNNGYLIVDNGIYRIEKRS